MSPIATSALPLPLLLRGKVRVVYEVDSDRVLLVATDRVSAFDVVMNEPVPHKGAVLTQITAWWLRELGDTVPNHMISADADVITREVPELDGFRDELRGRSMLCLRAEVVPVECVIRGYLDGSAWAEYSKHGTLAGEPLPAGLRQGDRLDPPIFSPATKATSGHDENITISRMVETVGAGLAARLEELSRRIYDFGRRTAEPRGIIVADTKFEFGIRDGGILLVDEVLTPDSSRFWPAAEWHPGGPQPSFDKQPLRDWLAAERDAGRWNGDAPPPTLPDSVIEAMSLRYLDAYRLLTGHDLDTSGLS